MKVFRLTLCFFIIFTFASCGRNELVDLSGFMQKYNETASHNLTFSDFIVQKNPDVSYTAVVCENGCNILLSLCEGSDKKIQTCKIALVKENGSVPTTDELSAFNSVIDNVMTAYCGFDSGDIIDSFGLNNAETLTKNGELTLRKDNYYFVYYSTSIISEFVIHNTYIKEIETTHKPESKPYFGEDFVIKDKETP